MINKVTLAVSMALLSGAAAAQGSDSTRFDIQNDQLNSVTAANSLKATATNDLITYIVLLNDEPVATYKGNVKGYKATSLQANKNQSTKLNSKSAEVKAYKQYIAEKHKSFLADVANKIGNMPKVTNQYDTVLNGMALKLTPQQAQQIAKLPQVKSVEKDFERKLHTDRGPLLINADAAWDGTATGVAAKGEGMIIGIIDTGINHDSPSFAATDPVDGYTHTNPLGDGVYLGECATTPGLCNAKLIGSYNFLTESNTAEDEDGHGSHTASTSGGNKVALSDSWQMSGVAPRANIINYKACCEGAALLSAIEQAVEDGVDSINYSIGASAPFANPWTDTDSQAFKAARAAGVFVATSAGNDGNGPTTVGSPANSPWLTSVAATTHDRGNAEKTIGSFSGGNTTLEDIDGQSATSSITASIVYAGDFSNGDSNPEQCLNPFPAGTFNGQIVVCDRGEIARVAKAENVAAGGAGGYVLANVDGGDTFIANDAYVVPGIHISATDGNALKAWLAEGTAHQATISEGIFNNDPESADIVAGFSSRGPNGYPADILAPGVAAPGVSIIAAISGDANNTGFLSGTSMASPHVAGAGALIKQLRPTWTAGQIHSALATTGSIDLRKEDGTTAADMFDIGGGRIDISAAANAGLVLDETDANFTAADPSNGGDPKTLNLPSMIDTLCFLECSWTRTVTATRNGSWTVSVDSDDTTSIAVSPSSFSLTEGQSQQLTITASGTGKADEWKLGAISLVPADSNTSTTRLPVGLKLQNSLNIDNNIEIDSDFSSGSHTIEGVYTISASDLTIRGSLSLPDQEVLSVTQDPTSGDPFDIISDEVAVKWLSVPAGAKRIYAETSNSSSPDLDLFVGIDLNGDGQPSSDELVRSSSSSTANELVDLIDPSAGNWWVLVQNWKASSESVSDDFTLSTKVVTSVEGNNLTFDAPSTVSSDTAFDIQMNWSGIAQPNRKWIGLMEVSSSAAANGDIGTFNITMNRGSGTFNASINNDTARAGEPVRVSVDVTAPSSGSSEVSTEFTLPDNVELVDGTLVNGATVEGKVISWSGTVSEDTTFSFDVYATAAAVGSTVSIPYTYVNDGSAEVSDAVRYFVDPSALITGLSAGQINAGETTRISFFLNDSLNGPNDISITTGNSNITIGNISGSSFEITADKKMPTVGIAITITVTDASYPNDTEDFDFTIMVVEDQSSGGGSTGLLFLTLLAGLGLSRRKR